MQHSIITTDTGVSLMNLREVVREFELPAPNPIPVSVPSEPIPVEPSPVKEVPVEV